MLWELILDLLLEAVWEFLTSGFGVLRRDPPGL